MSVSSDRHLGRIRATVLAALDGIDATVYLCGAHARGAGRWSNEIELAIEAAAPLPAELLPALYKKLEKSSGPLYRRHHRRGCGEPAPRPPDPSRRFGVAAARGRLNGATT